MNKKNLLLKEIKMIKKLMFVTVIIFSLVTVGMAQVQQNQQVNRQHTFDVTTPVTIEGKILEVTPCNTGKGRYSNGIRLTIANNGQGKNAQVILGPHAFMQAHNWELKTGETITIRAFKGTGNDSGSLFAAQLTRAGKQLELRDNLGRPLWRRSISNNRQGNGLGNGPGNGQGRGAGRNCRRNS
jgi:hypothetical protein